jgi:hypothetical protein
MRKKNETKKEKLKQTTVEKETNEVNSIHSKVVL